MYIKRNTNAISTLRNYFYTTQRLVHIINILFYINEAEYYIAHQIRHKHFEDLFGFSDVTKVMIWLKRYLQKQCSQYNNLLRLVQFI